MKRVLTAVVLIPIVLLAVMRAPVPLLAGLVAIISVLTTREALDLARNYGVQPIRLGTYIYSAIFLALIAASQMRTPLVSGALVLYGAASLAVLAPFIFLTIGMARRELPEAYPAAATSTLAFAWISLPLGMLVAIRQQWAGAFLILYLLIVVWAGDIAAYYAGRAFGRHKLAPRISPGKTWEGTVASFIAAVAIGTLWLRHAYAISAWLVGTGLLAREQAMLSRSVGDVITALILSGFINVAAQLGDLVESLVKRGAGVKDSGTLLPGHGGMLDRIDALLFAAPVLWCQLVWRQLS